MSSVQEQAEKDRKLMAANTAAAGDNAPADRDDEPSAPSKPRSLPSKPAEDGFFTIYKKGQGKWTRLGTVFVMGALGLLTTYSLYSNLLVFFPSRVLMISAVLFLTIYGLLLFYLTNKPTNADFLIATDSEMKKVNWTTGGKLVGSTRVVIIFLFIIATFLAFVDLIFAEVFRFIRVLQ